MMRLMGEGLCLRMSDLQKKSPNQLNKGDKLKGVFFEDSHFFAPGLIDSLMAVNKGKVVYMDFWATWCRPMSPSSKIKESSKTR